MSGILRLESLTKGNTLKQGDKTPLKYRLFDADGEKLNIAGKSAQVRLVYPDFLTIGYEKEGLTVAQDDTVTFTIDSVIPSRIYHVEIIVDGKFIFPSRADESKFTVDKSSLGTEANIIEIVGVDAVVRKAVDLINVDPSLIIDEDKLVTDIISNTGIGSINDYYQAFDDLKPRAELSISQSAEALTKSQNALNVANGIDAKATNALSLSESADTLSKSVQEQFNQIVINGDSSVEAAQARVDASGQTNPTLKARLDKEHNEVTTQLAQTAELTDSKSAVSPKMGVNPFVKNSSLEVLSKIDGDALNYVDFSKGDITGSSPSSTNENPLELLTNLNNKTTNYVGSNPTVEGTVNYENVLYSDGVVINETGQLITYPITTKTGVVDSGTVFIRFKPKQNFDSSANDFYRLLDMVDINEKSGLFVQLDYRSSQGYNGIEIRMANGSEILQLVLVNTPLNINQVYTLAITWDSNMRLNAYLNGEFARSGILTSNKLPRQLTKVLVGNMAGKTKPANSVIETVLFATESLSASEVKKLHDKPVDLAVINDFSVLKGDTSKSNLKYYTGEKFDGTKLLTYDFPTPLSPKSGFLSFRFKPLIDFNSSLNNVYYLATLSDGDNTPTVQITLHYADQQNYNGIEVRLRNGSNIRLLTISGMSFAKGEVYSIAVVWDGETDVGIGNVSVYINGLIARATTYETEKYSPRSISKLLIGNTYSGNAPANCEVESVVFGTKKVETSAILKMHRNELDTSAIEDPTVYAPTYKVNGYKREVGDVAVLSYDKTRRTTYGIHVADRSKLLTSEDGEKTWRVLKDFSTENNVIISMAEVVDDNLYVSVRDGNTNTLRKAHVGSDSFSVILNFNHGRYPISGWNFDSYKDKIVVSEYGLYGTPCRVWLSKDNGNTFNVIRTLGDVTKDNHFHGSKIDPYTGYIWLTYGDSTDGTEYSTDDGETWNVVTTVAEHQAIGIVFTEDAVIFGSDSVSGATHLRIFNKHTEVYASLSNPVFEYLNHVYALKIDDNGMLWWFGNREAMPNVRGTIYVSPDYGSTPIMLEDIGEELISSPYDFVQTQTGFYLGNSRITKPTIIEQ